MSLTVKQLVENPFLRTRFLAGTSGADNPVLWAHTCELPDPWNWLGTGDLLLTDGYNVPSGAAEQIEFLTNLAQGHLSGIALAEGLHAPPLTPEAAAVADTLAFPVLETAYEVPFVTVARTVADSNSAEASARLAKILRVYDVLRRSQQPGPRSDDLLEEVGKAAGALLCVVDSTSGRKLLPTQHSPGEPLVAALLEATSSGDLPLPGFLRLSADDRSALVLPVDPEGQVAMLAEHAADAEVDLVVLQHVATIAALEVERRKAAAVRRRVSGGRLFQQLIEASMDTETAAGRLAAAGLGERPWRVVSWSSSSGLSAEGLAMCLAAAGVPHLLLSRADAHLTLVTDGTLTADMCGYAGEPSTRIGISQPVQVVGRVADAVREARWAMETARTSELSVVEYGGQGPMFLPRTVAEGEAVVDAMLGPVLAYDEANDSDLLRSLEIFFEVNKSWQEGAKRLGIHKQTLVYRMRRVEELTRRRLSDLDDQTDLFLAVRTLRMLRSR